MSGTAHSYAPGSGPMLLLGAALGAGKDAIDAWEQWAGQYGLDHPDEGSYRLLPLVYRNLSAQGYTGALLNTLGGLHRHSWVKNQVLFGHVRPLIEELRAEGIPVLLLKGAALASSVYPDAGCRPMRDVDLLVPPVHARALCSRLEAAGWRPICWRPRSLPESFFQFRHAMDLEMPGGSRVDLHWHSMSLCCHSSADAEFWRNARPVEFCGLQMQTCQATEHLLQTCVHGVVWSPVPPVRWVADAMLLLRGGEVIDWDRLVGTTCRFDIVPYARRALALLAENFSAPVPQAVLRELERAPVSRPAAAEFARECAPFVPRAAGQDLFSFYARWRRSLGEAAPWLHPGGFARHLQYAFEFDSLGALPAQLARSAFRRLFQRRSPLTS